jgi:putative nucleotidyltransferase with HDIG domain
MVRIGIKQLRKGAVLAEDVHDSNQRLILAKGAAITGKHLRIFKLWGISTVAVFEEGDGTTVDAGVKGPQIPDPIRTDVSQIFQLTDRNHPAVRALHQLALEYRSRNLISPRPAPSLNETAAPGQTAVVTDIQAQIANNELKLPEIPATVMELNDIIADPGASAHDIGQVINKSPSLAGLLLRIVNSPFYGFQTQIDTISRAVTVIGIREISSLALGITAIKVFKAVPEGVVDMASFIRHSVGCGIAARILAARLDLAETEQLFVCGLLHDVGRLILYQYFPDHARHLLAMAAREPVALNQLESRFLGDSHGDIGGALMAAWNLPLTLRDSIVMHHRPMAAEDPRKAGIVHLADIVINAVGIGTSGERFVPRLDPQTWDILGLPADIFEDVVAMTEHQLYPLEAFLQGTTVDG